MQKYRRIQRRRAKLFLVDCLVIILFLIVWMVAREPVPTGRTIPYIKEPVPTGRAIPYNKTPGHILVQLAKLPKLPEAEMHEVPKWTLYEDGTLIFRTDPSDNLWRAQLSFSEIQHILDVIINQDKFFDNTGQRYGSITPDSDDDELLLTVDANGQHKEVVLASESTNKVAVDIQTTHVFAIEQFLLDYHPLHTVLYATNPDPDGVSDDGK